MAEPTVDVLTDLRTVMSLYDVDLTQTIAAVAALFEAATRLEHKAVEQSRMTTSVFTSDVTKLRAALARVGSAK